MRLVNHHIAGIRDAKRIAIPFKGVRRHHHGIVVVSGLNDPAAGIAAPEGTVHHIFIAVVGAGRGDIDRPNPRRCTFQNQRIRRRAPPIETPRHAHAGSPRNPCAKRHPRASGLRKWNGTPPRTGGLRHRPFCPSQQNQQQSKTDDRSHLHAIVPARETGAQFFHTVGNAFSARSGPSRWGLPP